MDAGFEDAVYHKFLIPHWKHDQDEWKPRSLFIYAIVMHFGPRLSQSAIKAQRTDAPLLLGTSGRPWPGGVEQEGRPGGNLTWWAPSCSPCRAGTCGVWGWAWWPRPGSAARPAAPGKGRSHRSGAGTRNRQTATCYNGLNAGCDPTGAFWTWMDTSSTQESEACSASVNLCCVSTFWFCSRQLLDNHCCLSCLSC